MIRAFHFFILVLVSYSVSAQPSFRKVSQPLYYNNNLKIELAFSQPRKPCESTLPKSTKYKLIITGKNNLRSLERYLNFKIDYVDCENNLVQKIISINLYNKNLNEGNNTNPDWEFMASRIERDFYDERIENNPDNGKDRIKGKAWFVRPETRHYPMQPPRPDSTFYDNGKLKSIKTYVNGKKSWHFKSFYDNGQLEEVRSYVNKKVEGEHVHFYRNGKVWYVYNYFEGKLNGESKHYYESGQLKSSAVFFNNSPIGEGLFFRENGQLSSRTNYNRNNRGYEKNEYDTTGALWRTFVYDGIKYKTGKLFHVNGNIMAKWTCLLDSAESSVMVNLEPPLHGECIEYYINGNIESIGNYSLDWKHGLWQWFFENGSLKQEGKYDNGLPVGEWKWYYNNGITSVHCTLPDKRNVALKRNLANMAIGLYKEYYKNGKLKVSGLFEDYFDGTNTKMSFIDGDIKEVCSNAFTGKIGEWKEYFESGNLKEVSYYKDGKKIENK